MTITKEEFQLAMEENRVWLDNCADCEMDENANIHDPPEPDCESPEEHHSYEDKFEAVWYSLCLRSK